MAAHQHSCANHRPWRQRRRLFIQRLLVLTDSCACWWVCQIPNVTTVASPVFVTVNATNPGMARWSGRISVSARRMNSAIWPGLVVMVVTWVYCTWCSFLFRRGRHQERLKNDQAACQNGCGSARNIPRIPLYVKLPDAFLIRARSVKNSIYRTCVSSGWRLSVIFHGSGARAWAWHVDMTPEKQIMKLDAENAAVRT